MLVLSRHREERVVIETSDGIIEVCLVRITSDERVQLGFEAPASVGVWRREIWENIQRERSKRT